jgi:hypothetical protein
MSDLTTRLRQANSEWIGRLDEDTYWACHEAADEIERLRLTDAEREAIAYYIGTGGPDGVDATLRSLLERTK